MKLYFAPMEGITNYIYRNTHFKFFGGCDSYFAPFLSTSENEKLTEKNMRDILPENNKAPLKTQILTNNAEAFVKLSDKMKSIGYDEVNINLGCPASTVAKKGKGSGMLRDTYVLEKFLDEIYEKSNVKVSIKTRAGFATTDEFDELLPIYQKYDMPIFILHGRAREDFYGGVPNEESYKKAYSIFEDKFCYNGNIFSAEDVKRVLQNYPKLNGIMIGRGAIKNPALFRLIRGGESITTKEVVSFTKTLSENYNNVLDSDTFTLHKIKEIWVYMIDNYPGENKITKALKKCVRLNDFISTLEYLPEIEKEM